MRNGKVSGLIIVGVSLLLFAHGLLAGVIGHDMTIHLRGFGGKEVLGRDAVFFGWIEAGTGILFMIFGIYRYRSSL